MSKQVLAKEEAINHLYSTIKTKFEEDGVLQEVRCLLQAKMVSMMRGKSEGTLVKRPAGKGLAQDSRIALLNQLLMEYFHWHNYQYSAEMFGLESGAENTKPMRECLEGVLDPILLICHGRPSFNELTAIYCHACTLICMLLNKITQAAERPRSEREKDVILIHLCEHRADTGPQTTVLTDIRAVKL
ncbi:hypothetical protein GQX74_000191 [Glossina fuscipes]|nr:hypothetical protein GQX74_000191 [Glossina fuscipes]